MTTNLRELCERAAKIFGGPQNYTSAQIDAMVDELEAAGRGDVWIKCSDRLPHIGQRVILKINGVVQHYMPILDQGDDGGFDSGSFWDFEEAMDGDYPMVNFDTDEWMPAPTQGADQ